MGSNNFVQDRTSQRLFLPCRIRSVVQRWSSNNGISARTIWSRRRWSPPSRPCTRGWSGHLQGRRGFRSFWSMS